jgi:hypothetical protein
MFAETTNTDQFTSICLYTCRKRAGWIEHQVALIDNNFMMLIQAEVDKFHAAIGLLIDYYAAQNQDSNTEILLVSSKHSVCVSCARV